MTVPTIKVNPQADSRKGVQQSIQPQGKHSKGLIGRIIEIVLNDIRRKLRRDRASRESQMRYEAFMEMVRK